MLCKTLSFIQYQGYLCRTTVVVLFNLLFSRWGYRVHTFPKCNCSNVNVIARQEFQLIYDDIVVHQVSHYTTRTHFLYIWLILFLFQNVNKRDPHLRRLDGVVTSDWVLSMAQNYVLMLNWIIWNCVLMLNWIVWNRTVFTLNCVLLQKWIDWNRIVLTFNRF